MNSNVCLVCANDLERQGLIHFLASEQFEVICSLGTLSEFPESLTSTSFLAILDVPDPDRQRDAVDQIKSIAPGAVAVILADGFDLAAMIDCFQAGAAGYIVKSTRSQPLMTALHLVALGEKYLPPDLADALDQQHKVLRTSFAEEPDIANVNPNLSRRERDVLCCLMAGYQNKLIARQLNVCEATIKVHVKAILRKLRVRNRTQAAIWANSNGFSEFRLAS